MPVSEVLIERSKCYTLSLFISTIVRKNNILAGLLNHCPVITVFNAKAQFLVLSDTKSTEATHLAAWNFIAKGASSFHILEALRLRVVSARQYKAFLDMLQLLLGSIAC